MIQYSVLWFHKIFYSFNLIYLQNFAHRIGGVRGKKCVKFRNGVVARGTNTKN